MAGKFCRQVTLSDPGFSSLLTAALLSGFLLPNGVVLITAHENVSAAGGPYLLVGCIISTVKRYHPVFTDQGFTGCVGCTPPLAGASFGDCAALKCALCLFFEDDFAATAGGE